MERKEYAKGMGEEERKKETTSLTYGLTRLFNNAIAYNNRLAWVCSLSPFLLIT